jgi:hypothetical protein
MIDRVWKTAIKNKKAVQADREHNAVDYIEFVADLSMALRWLDEDIKSLQPALVLAGRSQAVADYLGDKNTDLQSQAEHIRKLGRHDAGLPDVKIGNFLRELDDIVGYLKEELRYRDSGQLLPDEMLPLSDEQLHHINRTVDIIEDVKNDFLHKGERNGERMAQVLNDYQNDKVKSGYWGAQLGNEQDDGPQRM